MEPKKSGEQSRSEIEAAVDTDLEAFFTEEDLEEIDLTLDDPDIDKKMPYDYWPTRVGPAILLAFTLAVVVMVALYFLLLLPSFPASAQTGESEFGDMVAPTNGACEEWGCTYGHWCVNRGRPGYDEKGQRDDSGCEIQYGIAHQPLPDGPDQRFFTKINYPVSYGDGRPLISVVDSTEVHADPTRLHEWRTVIMCESRWDPTVKNSRSSASGLFQMISQTWLAYGGGEFASQARYATVMQQLTVAERILWAGYGPHGPQGPRAWSCFGAPAPMEVK